MKYLNVIAFLAITSTCSAYHVEEVSEQELSRAIVAYVQSPVVEEANLEKPTNVTRSHREEFESYASQCFTHAKNAFGATPYSVAATFGNAGLAFVDTTGAAVSLVRYLHEGNETKDHFGDFKSQSFIVAEDIKNTIYSSYSAVVNIPTTIAETYRSTRAGAYAVKEAYLGVSSTVSSAYNWLFPKSEVN